MRVVLDVNVWISGLLWGGVPKQILGLARSGVVKVFVSEPILIELREVLLRDKFQLRIRSLGIKAENLMDIVSQLSEVCMPVSVNVPKLRDPDDAVILGTAVAANAVVVSGDRDLLVLEDFSGILILSPTDCLGRLVSIDGDREST